MSNASLRGRVVQFVDNRGMAWHSRFRLFGGGRANTPVETGVLQVDGIEVHVLRKPIKNMYLRVKPPQGRVEVSASPLVSERKIASFVRARKSWIIKQQQRIAHQPATVSVGSLDDPQRRATAERAINAQLPQLLAKWEPIIGRTPTHITLRVMRTRWGSCTPKTGRIRLNSQLGLMDSKFLEYVLVHEMTHLWESGHGEAFQRHMDAYLPNWRQLRRELNRYSTQ